MGRGKFASNTVEAIAPPLYSMVLFDENEAVNAVTVYGANWMVQTFRICGFQQDFTYI